MLGLEGIACYASGFQSPFYQQYFSREHNKISVFRKIVWQHFIRRTVRNDHERDYALLSFLYCAPKELREERFTWANIPEGIKSIMATRVWK